MKYKMIIGLAVAAALIIVAAFFYKTHEGYEEVTEQKVEDVQDNTFKQNVPEEDKEEEAPAGSSTISAPGVTRPVGSTSERPTYPDATILEEDRPFETYIQMLVRSELAAQGVPTNEPFQVADVINGAGGYFKSVNGELMKEVK
jgi:cytoskeletal protein RodZ